MAMYAHICSCIAVYELRTGKCTSKTLKTLMIEYMYVYIKTQNKPRFLHREHSSKTYLTAEVMSSIDFDLTEVDWNVLVGGSRSHDARCRR